jgi:aminopeptidase N
MKFFEEYPSISYPYSKYSQVAVEILIGDMENTGCTTLAKIYLHDKKASIDFRDNINVLIHELAHQ